MSVLVVGAGPTGLALGIELERHGVDCRVIDRAAVRSDRSRALVVQARSLELMRAWGVADELVACGQQTMAAQIWVEKHPAANIELSDIGVDDTPYPFLLFVSQAVTERLCEAALQRLGGRVERPVELKAARPVDDGVEVTLAHAGGEVETARFDWVVGCDGAHSTVRHAAGLEFAGGRYEQDFLLADVAIRWNAPRKLYFFFGRGKNAVVMPLADGFSRIIGITGQAVRDDAPDEPPLEDFSSLLGEVCPFVFELQRPRWLARFRLHHRAAARYRAGRLLLAGDAAHIHSPAGGQGMNTGIQDAINLAWKLALVERGQAPSSLLDSYDEERRPVGERLLQFTDRLFGFASSPNPLVVWLRNRILPRVAPRFLRDKDRRRLAFRFISQLGIRYTGSSIVGDCGERAPDAVVGGHHLIDAFAAPKHHLLLFGGTGGHAAAAARRWAPHLDGRVLDDDTARQRYGIEGRDGWVLVRPDGYVGARGQTLDLGPLDGYFARIGISSSKRSM